MHYRQLDARTCGGLIGMVSGRGLRGSYNVLSSNDAVGFTGYAVMRFCGSVTCGPLLQKQLEASEQAKSTMHQDALKDGLEVCFMVVAWSPVFPEPRGVAS